MPYVNPPEVATTMLAAGATKANLSVKHLLIRGVLSGALLTGLAINLTHCPPNEDQANGDKYSQ